MVKSLWSLRVLSSSLFSQERSLFCLSALYQELPKQSLCISFVLRCGNGRKRGVCFSLGKGQRALGLLRAPRDNPSRILPSTPTAQSTSHTKHGWRNIICIHETTGQPGPRAGSYFLDSCARNKRQERTHRGSQTPLGSYFHGEKMPCYHDKHESNVCHQAAAAVDQLALWRDKNKHTGSQLPLCLYSKAGAAPEHLCCSPWLPWGSTSHLSHVGQVHTMHRRATDQMWTSLLVLFLPRTSWDPGQVPSFSLGDVSLLYKMRKLLYIRGSNIV